MEKSFSFFVTGVCRKNSEIRNRSIVFSVVCRDKVSIVDATETLDNSRSFGSKKKIHRFGIASKSFGKASNWFAFE